MPSIRFTPLNLPQRSVSCSFPVNCFILSPSPNFWAYQQRVKRKTCAGSIASVLSTRCLFPSGLLLFLLGEKNPFSQVFCPDLVHRTGFYQWQLTLVFLSWFLGGHVLSLEIPILQGSHFIFQLFSPATLFFTLSLSPLLLGLFYNLACLNRVYIRNSFCFTCKYMLL